MSIIIKDSIDYSRTCFNIYFRLSKSDINNNFDVHLFYWAKVRIPFVNNVYKAAQLARDMLAHVYILLIFPLCISTKNLYEKYNIIDTDALPPLQKYSRGNLKIYFADTENCIYISSYKREEILFLFYIRWRIFTARDKNCKKL